MIATSVYAAVDGLWSNVRRDDDRCRPRLMALTGLDRLTAGDDQSPALAYRFERFEERE